VSKCGARFVAGTGIPGMPFGVAICGSGDGGVSGVGVDDRGSVGVGDHIGVSGVGSSCWSSVCCVSKVVTDVSLFFVLIVDGLMSGKMPSTNR